MLNTLKNIALFFAAPLVGGIYIILFPFVGICVLAFYAGGWIATKLHDRMLERERVALLVTR